MSLRSNATNGRKIRRMVLPDTDSSEDEERNERPTAISHNVISHIQRLPDEFFCLIFVEYVESGNSPWHLTLICHRWYNVALSYHHLWANIWVGKIFHETTRWSIPGIAERVESSAQYQVCSTRKDLKEAIQRSGKVELAVKIRIWNFDEDSSRLMQELLVPGIADRIWRLAVSINMPRIFSLEEVPRKSIKPGKFFTDAPLTHLRSIHLDPGNDFKTSEAILKNIIHNGAKIQEATLDVSLMYEFIPTIPDSFWKSMKKFKDCTIDPDSVTVFDIIPLCKKLGSLQLTWRENEIPTLTIDNVTSLTIDTTPSFVNLSLPRLEHLQITVTFGPSDHEYRVPREATYPALKSLEIKGSDLTWMSKFYLPALESLNIDTTYGSSGAGENFSEFFLERLFPNLHKLKISSGCSEEELVSALHAVPNVRQLFFIPNNRSKTIGKELFARLAEMKHGELACRELKVVNITTVVRKVDAGEAKKMGDIRAKAGYPLERLVVEWWIGSEKLILCW